MSGRGVALVTGAPRRIGRELGLACARAGFDVALHARAISDLDETRAALTALGAHTELLEADLTDPRACAALVARSPKPLTLLVNCASVFEDDEIGRVSAETWDRAMAVNVRAPVLLTQALAAALPSDRDALVVNVVDQRVWRLNPRFFSYTASKAALWAVTQTLAQALAPRVRVNAIGPGPTLPSIHQSPEQFAAEAGATPLGRSVEPREIAAALAYLIEARAVTGQMIAVDSGQHLSWRTPDALA